MRPDYVGICCPQQGRPQDTQQVQAFEVCTQTKSVPKKVSALVLSGKPLRFSDLAEAAVYPAAQRISALSCFAKGNGDSLLLWLACRHFGFDVLADRRL